MASPGGSRNEAARAALLALAALLLGCAHATAPAAAPLGQPAPPVDSGLEGGARALEVRSQGLELTLPDAAGWRFDPRERHSWVARHLRSSSQLVVRAWRFEDIARPEDCEQQARLWRRELPSLAPVEQVEQREQRLAGIYRSRVTIGVRAAPRQPGRLLGYVLAFGSDARSCLLLAYSTLASGPMARAVIAARVALVEGTVFERLRRLDIEGRVSVPRR